MSLVTRLNVKDAYRDFLQFPPLFLVLLPFLLGPLLVLAFVLLLLFPVISIFLLLALTGFRCAQSCKCLHENAGHQKGCPRVFAEALLLESCA